MTPIEFGSCCSGIEAASVAWNGLGWKAAWFSEIEAFPCAVLAHHYPEVPNHGDMTTLPDRIRAGAVKAPDLLCGGTPCQAFSVAGNRNSLDDARGNLTLIFCGVANAIDDVRTSRGEPACVVVWENVPGVLTTKDNAFGCFLAELAGESVPLRPPGGGRTWPNAGAVIGPRRAIAWRCLDAQHFGLAQRRMRVFVVASARDRFDPTQVLFECEGMRRDTAPRREKGEKAAPTIAGCSNGGGGNGPGRDVDSADSLQVVGTLRNTDGGADVDHARAGHILVEADLAAVPDAAGCWWDGGQISQTLDAVLYKGQTMPEKNRFPAVLQPIAFSAKDHGADADAAVDLSPTLRAGGHSKSHANAGVMPAICVHATQDPCTSEDVAFALGRNTGQENAIAIQNATRGKSQNGLGIGDEGEPMYTLDQASQHAVAIPLLEVGKRTGESANNPRAGIGIGIDGDAMFTLQATAQHGVAVAIPLDLRNALRDPEKHDEQNRQGTGTGEDGDPAPTLTKAHVHGVALAFSGRERGDDGRGYSREPAIRTEAVGALDTVKPWNVATAMQVRRLTPRECERLQGFPDDYTLVPVRVKRWSPQGSGPCVKQTVTATVVDSLGRHFVGTNHCLTPQPSCARAGMPTGVGYELCRDICQQPAHAEINAIKIAGDAAKGAKLYLQGHTYACQPCIDAATAAGIIEIIMGPPPGNAADGPRYKAIGNSWAVPVVRWIGQRIDNALKGMA